MIETRIEDKFLEFDEVLNKYPSFSSKSIMHKFGLALTNSLLESDEVDVKLAELMGYNVSKSKILQHIEKYFLKRELKRVVEEMLDEKSYNALSDFVDSQDTIFVPDIGAYYSGNIPYDRLEELLEFIKSGKIKSIEKPSYTDVTEIKHFKGTTSLLY